MNHTNKEKLPSPCWILEETLLKKNLELIQNIKNRTGAKVLLALKGYALWKSFPLIKPYLDGCCASGLHEAKEKRDTDILFEIDEEASLYAIVCQNTKIDGGYYFADRVLRSMILDKGEDIYCTELEVRTTVHNIKYVILKLIETFIKSKQDKKQGEIVFKTLH